MNKSIGNYQIEGELGSGGFGIVYKGKHSILTERIVAIKVLHAHLSSPEMSELFLREAHFLEKLKHPNILHLFDIGVDQGFPYLVSEYAPGGSLRDLLKRSAPYPLLEREAITILSQIGEALYYAHQHNIIHRDLKPENILFNAQGQAFLADFGISRSLSTVSVKQTTTLSGSPAYMAPEQFQGVVCKESDQYSLGCIAYELVTGRQPFEAPDFFALAFQHFSASPVPPGQLNPTLSASVEQAILKAMAKQRTDRHADVRAFITALQKSLAQQTMTYDGNSTGVSPMDAPTYITPVRNTNQQEEATIGTQPSNRYAALQQRRDAIIPLPTQPHTPQIGSQVHQNPVTPVMPLSTGLEEGERTHIPSAHSLPKEITTSFQQPETFSPVDRPFDGTSEPQRKGISRRKWLLLTATSLLLVGSLIGVLSFHNTLAPNRVTVVPTHTATTSMVTQTVPVEQKPTHSTSRSKTSPKATPVPGGTVTAVAVVPTKATTTASMPAPTPTPTPTPTTAPTPTPTPSIPLLHASYVGSMSSSNGSTPALLITSLKEDAAGNFTARGGVGSCTGSFKGVITSSNSINFTFTEDTCGGEGIFSGQLFSDSHLAGVWQSAYYHSHGTWTVS